MKKVIAVSALAMAGMFSAQTLADESKTGFYVTGNVTNGAIVIHTQRLKSDPGGNLLS